MLTLASHCYALYKVIYFFMGGNNQQKRFFRYFHLIPISSDNFQFTTLQTICLLFSGLDILLIIHISFRTFILVLSGSNSSVVVCLSIEDRLFEPQPLSEFPKRSLGKSIQLNCLSKMQNFRLKIKY